MKNISLLCLLIVLFSCNSENKVIENENSVKEEKVIKALVSKYNIKYLWDTLNYKYSVDYKPIIDSKYQLIDYIEIIDIYEEDSSFFIFSNISYYPSINFTFSLSKVQIDQIYNSTIDNIDLIFVVNISELKKDIESSLPKFNGKGSIIEIKSKKTNDE